MRFTIFVPLFLTGCVPHSSTMANAAGKPIRIVSMNPCVDAVLMEVAEPKQIAAISHYSQDPRATSIDLKRARQYPAVSGSAEDVVALEPDLVIAGPHVSIQTIAALRRLGVPLMQVPVPETVADNEAQITEIAIRIGQYAKGKALNERIEAALADGRGSGRAIPALIWQGSGLVPGKGTLADDLLTQTGFRNQSAALGLKKWDILPLEGLLTRPPAILLSGEENSDAGLADANRMLSHPVLRKAGARIQIANYPSNLLHCGGPVIIRAVARLAAIRRKLEGRR
jgi:iron complex transport system substrate-binding protein